MRTAGYSLLDHMRNRHNLDKMKVTPITDCVNSYSQNWLQRKKEWTEPGFQNRCFDMPHWTTTARKSEEKTVGDRNRPLGLILEWKMMMN
jgi:hypothetical protein